MSIRLLLLVLLIAGCRGATSPSSGFVGRPAPTFTAKTLDGREVSLGSLRGKVVVLDVWACWCKSCRKELPLLDELAARRKTDGVEVLAVSIDEEREPIDRMLASRPSWSMTVLHEPSGKVGDAYGASSLPAVFVIDREGVVRFQTGAIDAKQLKQLDGELDGLLQEPISQKASR